MEFELTNGLEPLLRYASGDRDVFAIFHWRGIPLGARELTRGQLASRASLADAVAEAILPAVGARLFGVRGFEPPRPGDPVPEPPLMPELGALLACERPLAGLPEPSADEGARFARDATVVVATRERPDDLERLLASFGRLGTQPREIVVVDNGPDERTRAIVERSGLARYVVELRRGLSAARNAGIRASSGSIVAFTDDDAVVDAEWVERLCAGFDDPKVMAVTGLVLPASLDSPAQLAFERVFGGLGRGFHDVTYGTDFYEATKALGTPVWNLGAGVNLAVRREALERDGLFDERLGAGAAGCSEDSELLYRLLAHGWRCAYRADAIVRHHHRSDLHELDRQMHEYARGHVSALFVQYARHGDTGNLRRALVTLPRYFARRLVLRTDPEPKRRTVTHELRGYLRGLRALPWAFRAGTREPE